MNEDPLKLENKSHQELVDMLASYQRALESEKRYHATLDSMMEGFQMISFDWRYLYVNDTVVRQSRFQREELLGHTMMEKYPGIEKTPLFRVLNECMSQRNARNFENEFVYPDGSVAWFDLSIQPTREGLFILSTDITAKKTAEKEKTEYVQALEEMIFITSHKLRQPITQIMGIAGILSGLQKLSQEDLQKIILYMNDAAKSLDQFTKELSDFLHRLDLKMKGKNP